MEKLVAISDLHNGSVYGLLPPKFITSEGIPKLQNVGQSYLWKCWLDFVARVGEFKPHVVIVNGDVIDGRQQAQRGTELSLPILQDQKESAIETLMVLRKATGDKCKYFFLSGTPYHSGDAAEFEEDIAQRLGAEKYKSVGTGRYCRRVLDLEIDGILLNVMHGISVGSGFYRATSLDREAQWSAMVAKDASKGIPKADVLIRGHGHFFGHVEYASKHIYQLPCWQLQTQHMAKNSAYRMLPDIGGLMMEIDGKAKARYEDPVKHIKHLYPLPAAPVNKL